MAIDLAKLAGQGRAFSGARAWEPEELEALLSFERERGIGRLAAADYVRNGILTLESFDAAVEAEFKPKTLIEAAANVEASLRDNEFATDTEAVKKAAEKADKAAAKQAEKEAKAAAKAAEKATKEAEEAKNE